MSTLKRFTRIFRRHFWPSTINLVGLALGMGVFITIQLYVYNQENYDTFWESADSIHRISAVWDSGNGKVRKSAVPPPVAPYLAGQPGVSAITRMIYWSDFTFRPDNDSSRVFRETNVYEVDSAYFRVFSNRLIYGDEKTALSRPYSVILSEDAARRYFGDLPLSGIPGRMLLGGKDGGTPWEITGIMKNIPGNSHKNQDILVRMSDWLAAQDDWTWHIMHTYARFDKTLDEWKVQQMLDGIVTERIIPHFLQQGVMEAAENSEIYHFVALPIREIHIQDDWQDAMRGAVRGEYLEVLTYAGLLVFMLACINFINISTSLSFYRTAEIGIRKMLGSSRYQLFLLLVSEYVIYALIALILALGINEFFIIGLEKYLSIELVLTPVDIPGFILNLSLFLILVSLAAASYPVYMILRGKPVRMKRGSWRMGRNRMLRDGLIIFQFFIAVCLIGFSLTVDRQLTFMHEQQPGFTHENIIVIQNDGEIEEERRAFISEITRLPEVASASFTTGIPALSRYHIRDVRWPGESEHFPVQWYETDEFFLPTLGVELLEGRNFSGMPADSGMILINETAARLLGNKEITGRQVVINEGSEDERRVTVGGIIRDLRQEGFRREVEPLVLEYLDNYTFRDFAVIRTTSKNLAETRGSIEQVWRRFEPEVPMSWSYLNANFTRLFESELLLARVFGFFSVLALIIAAIGLFGVSSVVIKQQMHETGIRKVFGATTGNIMQFQLRRFMVLVVTGLGIAIPAAWYASSRWLGTFVVNTQLSFSSFFIPAVSVFMLTLIIVGITSWIGAITNPLDHLRSE